MIVLAVPPCSSPCATSIATLYRRRLTFAWVVEEEIGLVGSRARCYLPDVTRVYAVDTFVSSDAPLESQRLAFAPLGRGAVLRAMDSGTVVPPPSHRCRARAGTSRGIPLQYGMTAGWNDGASFAANGVVNVPLSWPGRYSHSPVEVADLRDIEALVQLIVLSLGSSGALLAIARVICSTASDRIRLPRPRVLQ